jgi:hypothetical protein
MYSIDVDDNHRFNVRFTGEPNYIRGLQMAPSHREFELESGVWLVVAFAVWSIHDRASIGDAVAVTKRYGGRFNLGVRPFDSRDEFEEWLPGGARAVPEPELVEHRSGAVLNGIEIRGRKEGTPLWFWFAEGRLVQQRYGTMAPAIISDFIENALRSSLHES